MAVMLVCDSTSQCKNVFAYKVLQSLSTKGFEGELICIYVYIHIYISWNQVTNHWPSLSKTSYLYIVRSSHNQHYAHGMAVMLVCASISQCTSDFHSKFDDHCQNEVACTWWHWHGNTNQPYSHTIDNSSWRHELAVMLGRTSIVYCKSDIPFKVWQSLSKGNQFYIVKLSHEQKPLRYYTAHHVILIRDSMSRCTSAFPLTQWQSLPTVFLCDSIPLWLSMTQVQVIKCEHIQWYSITPQLCASQL